MRAGASLGVAGFFLLGGNSALQNAIAEGDTRTLSFHHVHTGEDITITFKRDGRYDEAALKKLDWFMRDWRKDEQVKMDPHLFDLLWETYREVNGKEPIQVIGGYRSPGTNAMLRARSSGVAETSQHTAGHAMDFFIPNVSLAKVREIGLRLQRGGVGFYPSSGSPFVHLDIGTVRHWPRMTYAELQKVFPDGRTVHVASDGRPLPGYALALADVEHRGNTPNTVSLEAARKAGVITASQEAEAATVAANHAGDAKPGRNLLASLFGLGKKETDQAADEQTTVSAKRAPKLASAQPAKPVPTDRIVPLPSARPRAAPVAVASAEPTGRTFQTASATFDARGVWTAPVDAGELPIKASPFLVADAGPATTGTTPEPLAYAAAGSEALPATRARPMGKAVAAVAAETKVVAATAVGVRSVPPLTFGGQRFDSPWLRAAMLTPSVHGVMTVTPLGAPDPRPLAPLLQKPADSLIMSFSADPAPGLMANRFSGQAVVFLATTTFVRAKTASLR